MCFLGSQLHIARALAEACPDTALVLDHCGVPDIAGGDFDQWAAALTSLAGLPNVTVKLSGLTAYCAPGTATAQTLRPWVEHVLASFGPERMLWGGDWPVVNLGSGLPRWIDMTRDLLSELSADEQAGIGYRTAQRVYRLPPDEALNRV